MKKHIAFLRGINVSGHHKVPMVHLRQEMKNMGFQNIVTILNSGNVIFDTTIAEIEQLEPQISTHLSHIYKFTIPVVVREWSALSKLIKLNPFETVSPAEAIRYYVTFLPQTNKNEILLPHTSDDTSFKVIACINQTVFSTLDLSISSTPAGMAALEKMYGRDVTTRNWNTILRIKKKIATEA